MRPAHAYANLTDQRHHELVDARHRQSRIATRAVMILLSASGMSANEIAGLRRIPRQPPAGTGRLDLIGVVVVRATSVRSWSPS